MSLFEKLLPVCIVSTVGFVMEWDFLPMLLAVLMGRCLIWFCTRLWREFE